MLRFRDSVALVAMAFCSSAARADELFDTWVRDKLPEAFSQLPNGEEGYTASSVSDCADIKDGVTVTYRAFTEYKATGDWRFLSNHVRDVQPPEGKPNRNTDAFGVNSRYRFVITKAAIGEDYLFKSVTMNGETPSPHDQRLFDTLPKLKRRPFQDAGSVSVLLVNGKFGPGELRNIPGFNLLSATERDGGRKLVVEFSYTPLDAKGVAGGEVSRCSVVYDLDRYGVPVEQTERCLRRGTLMESRKTYDVERAGAEFVIRTSYKATYTSDGKVTYGRSSDTRTVVKLGALPETEFTLSAFGLPEPVGVTWEKPTPLYVWLLAAAGGCAVLALLLRLPVRRRQAARFAV